MNLFQNQPTRCGEASCVRKVLFDQATFFYPIFVFIDFPWVSNIVFVMLYHLLTNVLGSFADITKFPGKFIILKRRGVWSSILI